MTKPLPLARGDVVLVPFPLTDSSAQRVRPVLIVGRVSGLDVIVAFITSRLHQGAAPATYIFPRNPEFDDTGLRVASAVRLDKLATIPRQLVLRRLGRIGSQTTSAVAETLRYVFSV